MKLLFYLVRQVRYTQEKVLISSKLNSHYFIIDCTKYQADIQKFARHSGRCNPIYAQFKKMQNTKYFLKLKLWCLVR